MKNFVTTSEFKKYIKNYIKKNQGLYVVPAGEDYIIFTNYFAFRTNKFIFSAEIAPVLGIDHVITKPETVSGAYKEPRISDFRNYFDVATKKAEKTILSVDTGKTFASIFKCEKNGIIVDEVLLDLFHLDNAEFYSAGKKNSLIVAKTAYADLVICPIHPSVKVSETVDAIIKAV